MKKIILVLIFVALSKNMAYAGFLTGNSSPYIAAKGLYAVKLNASTLMAQTPFSAGSFLCKYGYDDKVNIYGKYSSATIDYSVISGFKLTTDPQASTFGLEYIYNGSREAAYESFVVEYETVEWSVNRVSNSSTEILLGFDFIMPLSNNSRTRYRLAINNFNAGTESEEKIATTTKYSLSTELEYYFTGNIRGSFEAGMYFGDPNGLLSTFGFGLGFGS